MLGIQKGQSKRASLIAGMISSLIGDLVLSFILAHFIIWSDASTIGWGALIGFLVWCGFFAAPKPAAGHLRRQAFQAVRNQQRLLADWSVGFRGSYRGMAIDEVNRWRGPSAMTGEF